MIQWKLNWVNKTLIDSIKILIDFDDDIWSIQTGGAYNKEIDHCSDL